MYKSINQGSILPSKKILKSVPCRAGKKIEIRAVLTENRHGSNPGINTPFANGQETKKTFNKDFL